MYILAINYHSEGRSHTPYKTLELLYEAIQSGSTYGNEFKIFKEIPFIPNKEITND